MAAKVSSARYRSMKLFSSDDLEVDPLLAGRRRRYRRRRSSVSDPYFMPSSCDSAAKNNILSCVGLSNKRAKNLVTLLVGEEQRAFRVEPQILDHGVVQCLLEKSGSPVREEEGDEWRQPSTRCPRIRVDCDAILFEHILWLLNNDDPSLRHLNVDELMEFYA